MILSTTNSIEGHKTIENLGLVQGNSVRAKHFGRDLMASLKNIVGGELKGYTELMSESRKEATERMIIEAEKINANAVIGIRFTTSSIAEGASEIFVFGTAVKIE